MTHPLYTPCTARSPKRINFEPLETARYPTKGLVIREAAKDLTIWATEQRPHAITVGSLIPWSRR
jgi:hypothetical protein